MDNFDKLIQEKKLMQPLWISAPCYSEYSMAWRMGSGEGEGGTVLEKWEKPLPEIFALGFYFQLAQNEKYRNQVLKDFPADTVAVCLDENDTLLGAKITDSGELVGKNIIGFALMNALAEIRKIYSNVHLCENAEH